MLRELMHTVLARAGYTVLSAENPDQTLEIAAAHPGTIHLLLSDVILPGLNGRAFAEKLQKERSEAKVLFVSGYTEDIILHHGTLEAGTSFLTKPFTQETLGRKIREVLDRPVRAAAG